LYDTVNKCYALQGYATKKVIVSSTNCPSPCYSGIEAPKLDKVTLTNICPSLTANLNSINSSNLPRNTVLSWHTSLPASSSNKVSNPASVSITGAYYASFYDPTNNCYSANGNAATSVWVEIVDCNSPCASGSSAPNLSATSLKNVCPIASADLSNIFASNRPFNSSVILEWHTATPANALNKVANSKSVGSGTYYAVFYDTANNCYSGNGNATSQVLVSLENCANKCIAGSVQPVFAKTTLTNVCPSVTVNLNSLVASNQPKGTIIEWRANTGTVVVNATAVVAGTYTALFKDTLNNCYSSGNSSTVSVVLSDCKALVAVYDQVSVNPKLGFGNPLTYNVGANDTFNSTSKFSIPWDGKPKKGTASINPSTGILSYTLNDSSFIGYDTVKYNLCDTVTGKCSSAYAVFTVAYPKDTTIDNNMVPGSGKTTVYVYPSNTGIPILPSGASQVFTVSQVSANGTVTIDPVTGKISYTGNSSACGKDSFKVARTYVYSNGTKDVFYSWVFVNNNCESIDFPNYLSPNGDGVNDVFVLPSSYVKKYPDAKLVVFNRWGSIVWRSYGPYQNNWDGVNYDSQTLPDGVYYYMIEGSTQPGFQPKSGFVEIMRN
jgi:gliding motility-associated-like protein